MRQEGAGQAAASCCREREPPCDQQAAATGTRGERGWFLLSSANVIAKHLCFKSHQLFVIMLRVTLEMSAASWQGFKHSGVFGDHLTSCYLLDLKIKPVFPEQRI